MADLPATSGDSPPEARFDPPATDQADVMNDPAFTPKPTRRDTVSSKASEGGSVNLDTCRICRSEGTPEEPLFYPCKCSGSIKFVHQECLMEWLGHTNKKHCELCKTPFHFTKLYDANMPQTLPWGVFLQRAAWHIVKFFGRAFRSLVVGLVWLGFIPYTVRLVWKWLFWIADAAWAKKDFVEHIMKNKVQESSGEAMSIGNANASSFAGPLAYKLGQMLARGFGVEINPANSTNTTTTLPPANDSVLSSWSYFADLTPSKDVNKILLHVFEGQMITCVIIVGFILVFLIREWVVQQQPLINLENLDNVQQQLREAADRVQADNERLRRQEELLEQARRRLVELQTETDGYEASANEEAQRTEFMGWEALEKLIDRATDHLRRGDETERFQFLSCAQDVSKQIRAAGSSDIGLDDFTEKVFQKLAGYNAEERKEWEAVLVSEIETTSAKRPERVESDETESGDAEDGDWPTSLSEPALPNTDFSSRATQIKQLLQEADTAYNKTSEVIEANTAGLSEANAGTERDHAASAASSESWQRITPPSEPGPPSPPEEPSKSYEPLPVTNAGPDAKINIKRNVRGKMRAVPEPKIEEKMLTDDELKKRLEDEVMKELEQENQNPTQQERNNESSHQSPQNTEANDNPFHPDGPPPERRNSESFGNRVASVFREEFGLDEAEQLENRRGEDTQQPRTTSPDDGQPEERQVAGPENAPPGLLRKMADWFWGDIQLQGAPEPVAESNEERVQHDNPNATQEAPFVPVQNEEAVPEDLPATAAAGPEHFQHDPEVVAAAQQAGLDAEAIEDAEDLEGIFELIGLQGPLIGLLQTSAFCTMLVACTILCAVILPYVGGKMVLNVVGSPFFFLIQMPLQFASLVADFVVDISLLFGGYSVMVTALASDYLLSAAQVWLPSLCGIEVIGRIVRLAANAAEKAGSRLVGLFLAADDAHIPPPSWTYLELSAHAHASLKTMQGEINTVLSYTGAAVTWVVEAISTGSVTDILKRALSALTHVSELPAKLTTVVDFARQYADASLSSLQAFSKGTVTLSTPEVSTDPALVYWNSTDRALAILAGYAALAALAAIYVAADTPITKSEAGRKHEKMIRDTLRQAGGVFKVILIISIEMLVFPLYCGMLLDVAFLPLFNAATLASRWEFAGRRPNLFCFVHWFVGTCYMFHFALFVGMCRKILRKGVLWFIRDPDDPTFHPVRDVLERNVGTQLRKIAFSALVYGALVILCLGGVIWTIGQLFDGIFPIHWTSTEPILEFPIDLLLYNFVTPLVIRLFKPSDAVNTMYAWWLRRCARVLRLSHFLFDDRRKDEEGHTVRRSWTGSLLRRNAVGGATTAQDEDETVQHFKHDGRYVLTPCNDQYRPPKLGEAFLHADDGDVYIADKEGKKNEHFAKVYVPPWFRTRLTLFMVCLWAFSAFTGLCSTLVPLVFGRHLFAAFLPADVHVNDIYAYSVGAYILGGIMFVAMNARAGTIYVKTKAASVNINAWITPVRRAMSRMMKCAYVYGFFGVALPVIFALFLQFYLILPLHTWSVAGTNNATLSTIESANITETASAFLSDLTDSTQVPTQHASVAEHTVHVLQEYALGLLYVRMASRLIIAAPTSRAAEAFRRVTADGYFNPNVRLATRFFVLPILLITMIMLLLPPGLIGVILSVAQALPTRFTIDTEIETQLYRYSYPTAATCVLLVLATGELGKATSRWRARVRDEVYLVGERLHNFGEKKPPTGSKSVVRKER